MKHVPLVLGIFLLFSACEVKAPIPTGDLQTPFEQQENYSASYEEGIAYYEKLDGRFTKCKLKEVGKTDSGKPLHLAILSKEMDFELAELADSEKPLFFINNAIHPGEPCGVDATMMLFRDILTNDTLNTWLDKVNIVAIPYYNISGAMNRNSTTRANQNGPQEYGFRGNIKNLDLNRDFIKADSKNARAFNRVFAKLKPDVFIDNHTSNGADYQHTMTLINTIPEKLTPPLGTLLRENMLPFLYADMKARGWEMTPYVNTISGIPDNGIAAFNDLPRYSNGYAALHNSLAFTGETHMLKPFKDRVISNYELMQSIISWMADHAEELTTARTEATESLKTATKETLSWEIDTSVVQDFTFKGYKAMYKPSEIHGKDRLYYNRDSSFTKTIKYYDTYKESASVEKPMAYYIPQAWERVIERLKWNGVQFQVLDKDVEVEGTTYYIEEYETVQAPYESHYLHYNVRVRPTNAPARFSVGDYKVPLGQAADKYIVATLEPEAPDSYFAWNFFDGILMQKEYFSPYVFEDRALELLKENPSWKTELEEEKKSDEQLRTNARAQLNWIYKKSDHYEKSHLRYPVVRGSKETILKTNVYTED